VQAGADSRRPGSSLRAFRRRWRLRGILSYRAPFRQRRHNSTTSGGGSRRRTGGARRLSRLGYCASAPLFRVSLPSCHDASATDRPSVAVTYGMAFMDSRSDNPGNGHSNSRSDSSDDGQWMTYAELAEARGIKLRAAVRQVQRQALRRQPGNDGKTRVWVPYDILEASPRPEQKPSQRPSPRPGHSATSQRWRGSLWRPSRASRTRSIPCDKT
jgi:hypothetical protein